jgi:hypothetical protein
MDLVESDAKARSKPSTARRSQIAAVDVTVLA